MAEKKNWGSDRTRQGSNIGSTSRDSNLNRGTTGSSSGSMGSGGSRGSSGSGSYGSNVGRGSKGPVRSDEDMGSESDFERNRGRRYPSDEDISE